MALNLPQNIAGAVSDATAPQPEAAPMPSAPQMTPDEMIADLENKAAAVEGKNAALKSGEITGANNLDAMRAEIIQDLFETLKKNGVNPGDPQSVRDFLEKLAEQDPDLFEVFEMAFNNLVGEEGAPLAEGAANETPAPPMGEAPVGGPPAPTPTIPAEGGGLMDKFSNLAGGVMR